MGVLLGQTMRLDLVGDTLGVFENVQSYQYVNVGIEGVSSAEALSDAVEILTALFAIVSQLHNIVTIFRKIRAQNVQTLELLGLELLDPTWPGLVVDQLSTHQSTAVLSFPTVIPRVILKKMFGPLSEGSLDAEGLLTAGPQSLLAQAGAEMLSLQECTYTDWLYGYYSPKTLANEFPIGAQFITAPGSRRSRKPGVGN